MMDWSSPTFIFGCIVAYLAITIWIVSKYHTKEATEEDFYVAGRSVGYIPNSFSIVPPSCRAESTWVRWAGFTSRG